MILRSSLDNPDTIPESALNPSHKIRVHLPDSAVPLRFASTKLAMPRQDLVLTPSVFLANRFSLASVSEHARSITPIFATFSMNASVTTHDDPNLPTGVFI